jgi:hypothetical protein
MLFSALNHLLNIYFVASNVSASDKYSPELKFSRFEAISQKM